MFKTSSVFLLVTLVIGGTFIQLLSLFTPSLRPTLTVAPESLRLTGRIPQSKITGIVHATNSGNRPLKFDVSKSCACFNAIPMSGTIDPHGCIDIKVIIELNDYDAQTNTWVAVTAGRETQVCTISGVCEGLLKSSLSSIDFGSLDRRNASNTFKEVKIERRDGAAISMNDLQFSMSSSQFTFKPRLAGGTCILTVSPKSVGNLPRLNAVLTVTS